MDPQDVTWMQELLNANALCELANEPGQQKMSLSGTNSVPRTPFSSPVVSTPAIIDPWLATATDVNNSLPLFMPLENDRFFEQFAGPQPQINMDDLSYMPKPQDTADHLLLPNPTCICPGILQQPMCLESSLACSLGQTPPQEIQNQSQQNPNLEEVPSRKELCDL